MFATEVESSLSNYVNRGNIEKNAGCSGSFASSSNLRALILTRHCPGDDITLRSPLLFEQLL